MQSIEGNSKDHCISLHKLNLLMIWFSPSFPIGSFAYSHGLETAVHKGNITNLAHLIEWIDTVLLYGSGRADGVLFRETYKAVSVDNWDRLEEISKFSKALLPTEELSLESCAQGEAFLNSCGKVWSKYKKMTNHLIRPTYPVATGYMCAAYSLPLGPSLSSWYQSLSLSLVSAGVRLIPLGQTDGLRALDTLGQSVIQAYQSALSIEWEDLGTAAPLLEIDSIHHETQYSRLFRS